MFGLEAEAAAFPVVAAGHSSVCVSLYIAVRPQLTRHTLLLLNQKREESLPGGAE